METLVKFLGLVVSTVLKGVVVCQYWSWFIQPTFGLPPLTIPTGLGVSTLISYMTYQFGIKRDDKATTGVLILAYILVALVLLAYGWILTRFMQ